MIARVVPQGVVGKDLRLRMRGWRWGGVTVLYITVLGLIAVGFLLKKYTPTPSASTHAGIALFQTLSIFQLFLIVFVTPASMAGAISGERQRRTWDLLVISRLSALEIVWGKLLAGMASNLLLVAASLPLYCLVFLFGGVGPRNVVGTFLVFIVTILLLGVISLIVSALTPRLVVSFMVGLFVSLLLTVGLAVLALYVQAPNGPGVLSLSGIPFQSENSPSVLTPFAQLDPLIALLSALPNGSGGNLLGGIGTVHHAFGLPWRIPLWEAYSLLAVVLSILLFLAAVGVIVRTGGSGGRWRWVRPMRGTV
jgi:ABC-2 type transport system permease protein